MRVATYSRFSSDLQDRRSIVDQQRELHAFARARDWVVVADYADEAASGASLHGRPALADCLAQGRAGVYDGILLESLDRLSRSVADTATVQRELDFHGVKLLTIADGGAVPPLMLAIKGAISEQYLVDLGQKVRRGQVGRVKAGKIPGGLSFAYRVVRSGEREIVPEQAAIVRRIFREYIAGRSALKIATRLNAEGIPGPRGGPWNASTILGNPKRGTGIIHNRNYVGWIDYNRLKYPKNPTTGKRQSRLNAKDQVHSEQVPSLRIIDDEVWNAAQRIRKLSGTVLLRQRRRPRRILSGLLQCECGANYIITQGDWCGCSAYKNRGTCTNKRMIKMAEVERRVFDALSTKLMAPETVAAAVEEYRIERERLSKLHAKDKNSIERELGEANRKLVRAMEAMLDAHDDVTTYTPRIKELSAKVRELESKMPGERVVVTLHPNAADRYKQTVKDIQAALARGDAAAHDAVQLVRGLITKIIVKPEADRMGLEVLGDLAVLMGARTDVNAYNVLDGCGGRI